MLIEGFRLIPVLKCWALCFVMVIVFVSWMIDGNSIVYYGDEYYVERFLESSDNRTKSCSGKSVEEYFKGKRIMSEKQYYGRVALGFGGAIVWIICGFILSFFLWK